MLKNIKIYKKMIKDESYEAAYYKDSDNGPEFFIKKQDQPD